MATWRDIRRTQILNVKIDVNGAGKYGRNTESNLRDSSGTRTTEVFWKHGNNNITAVVCHSPRVVPLFGKGPGASLIIDLSTGKS